MTTPRAAGSFDVDLQDATLKEKSIRGGLVTMSCQAIDSFLRIASIAVLARILMPESFGLISMVTAVTTVAERFKDFGLSTATVQQKHITHEQISKLFWVNAAIGLSVALLISSVSSLIARFFHEPRLTYVTIAISTGFVWSGLTIQHQAILQRRLKYASIGAIQVSSTAISLAIAIVLALEGYGYWSLVWREVLRNAFIALATWICCPWTPGPPRRHVNVGRLITFGRDITGFNLIVFLTASVDQILIGKIFGAAQLGIYRQAFQMIFSPVRQLIFPVTSVAEPTLCFLQDDPPRYRRYYLKMLTTLNFVIMPLIGFLIVYSHEAVLVLLGPKWLEASKIFRVFAISAFVGPASDTTGFLLVTCGRTTRYLNIGLASGVILLFAFGVGVLWGVLGIAYGYLAATYVLLLVRLRYSFDGTPVDAMAFLKALEQPFVASMIMMMTLLAFNKLVLTATGPALLAIASPIALVTYFLTWITMPGGKHKLKEIVRDLLTSLHLNTSLARVNSRSKKVGAGGGGLS